MKEIKQVGDSAESVSEKGMKDISQLRQNVWSVKKSVGGKEEIFEVEITPGVYSLLVAKLDKMGGPFRLLKASATLCKEKISKNKDPFVLHSIWNSQEIGNDKKKQSVEFEASSSCILQIKVSSPVKIGHINFFASVNKIRKLNLATLYYEGPQILKFALIFLGVCSAISYVWYLIQLILSISLLGINVGLVSLGVLAYWIWSTEQVSKWKIYLQELDYFDRKTPFQKIKTLSQNRKNKEKNRELQDLNKEFVDDE